MSNKLDDAINDINDIKEKVKETAKESEDVKNKKCSLEDEEAEPSRVLYDQICENTMNLLKDPNVSKVFIDFGKKFGEDTSRDLTVLMATCMTQSAYNAIVFYDELLKTEIQKNYEIFNHNINLLKGSVEAMQAALEVFRKRLSDVETTCKIDKINKDINK